MNRRMIATIGAAGAIALGAVPALAQDTGTEDTTSEQSVEETKEERRAARDAAFAEALATELGLPTEDVAAALTTVREELKAEAQAAREAAFEERLAAAVEAGELTQEQADAIADAREAGVLEGPRHGRRGHGPRGFGPGAGPEAPADAA